MRILHKIRKITIAALAVSFVMVTCFIGRVSAASTSGSYYTTLSGYKGTISIADGRTGGVTSKGDMFSVAVRSSLGHSEDVSGLKVSWSVNDRSAVSVTDNGFNKSDDAWEATVKILKAGTHQYGTDGWNPTVYATVNGHKLSDEIFVYPNAVRVQKIGLSNSAVTIGGKGNTTQIKIICYPVNTVISGERTTFSSNAAIAIASYHNDPEVGEYALVTAVANGTTNITIKDSNGAHATCQVTVTGAGTPAVSKKSITTNKAGGKKTSTAKSNMANNQTGTTDNSGVTFNSIGQPIQNNDESESANSKSQSENKTSSGMSSEVGTVSYDINGNNTSDTDSDDSGVIGAVVNDQNDAGSKSNMKPVIMSIIIIICVCLLVCCCVYYSKKKKAKEKLDETKEIKINRKSHKK